MEEKQSSSSSRNLKWSISQKFRYYIFLKIYQEQYQKKVISDNKYSRQWLKKMSRFIYQSQSPNKIQDCLRHHNVFIKQFRQVKTIMQFFQQQLLDYEQDFNRQLQRASQLIEIINKQVQQQMNQFQEVQKNKRVKLLKIQPVNPSVKCSFINKKVKKGYNFQSISSANSQFKLQISNQFLLILKKELPLKSLNLQQQTQRINQIIQNFQTYKQKQKKTQKNKTQLQTQIKPSPLLNQGQAQNSQDYAFDNDEQKKKKYYQRSQLMTVYQGNDNYQNFFINPHQEMRTNKKKQTKWTNSQSIRMMVFLNIHKNKMSFKDNFERKKFYIKCSQYINTNKTPTQCSKRIFGMAQKYNKQMQKMIQSEIKILEIPEQLLQREQLNYFNQQISQRYGIKINLNPNKLKLRKRDKFLFVYQLINQKIEIDSSFDLQFYPIKSQDEKRQEKDVEIIQEENIEIIQEEDNSKDIRQESRNSKDIEQESKKNIKNNNISKEVMRQEEIIEDIQNYSNYSINSNSLIENSFFLIANRDRIAQEDMIQEDKNNVKDSKSSQSSIKKTNIIILSDDQNIKLQSSKQVIYLQLKNSLFDAIKRSSQQKILMKTANTIILRQTISNPVEFEFQQSCQYKKQNNQSKCIQENQQQKNLYKQQQKQQSQQNQRNQEKQYNSVDVYQKQKSIVQFYQEESSQQIQQLLQYSSYSQQHSKYKSKSRTQKKNQKGRTLRKKQEINQKKKQSIKQKKLSKQFNKTIVQLFKKQRVAYKQIKKYLQSKSQ